MKKKKQNYVTKKKKEKKTMLMKKLQYMHLLNVPCNQDKNMKKPMTIASQGNGVITHKSTIHSTNP